MMKLGINEVKEFFSNKRFRWFDRKSVRDEGSLTVEELKYITSWTIAPLGFGTVFYLGKRILPDLFFVYIVTYIFFEVDDTFGHLVTKENVGVSLYIGYILLALALSFISLYTTYFLFRHGKRLSWNRGRYITLFSLKPKIKLWESVQELKESEKRYVRYGVIPSAIISVIVFLFLLS